MTKEQVIKWAQEARLCGDPKDLVPLDIQQITAFATLVRNSALDEAAMCCGMLLYQSAIYPGKTASEAIGKLKEPK